MRRQSENETKLLTKNDMENKFFEKYPDYKIEEKPSLKLIKNYREFVPKSLIDFWEQYGFGSFMNGYLKIVNPDDYQDILDEAYENEDCAIVVAITGLGDFIVWNKERGWFYIIFFRHGTTDAISNDFEKLLHKDFVNDDVLRLDFNVKDYYPAKERLGELEFNQCFGYVPLLGIGGSEQSENLDKVGIEEHIYIISQMVGKVED